MSDFLDKIRVLSPKQLMLLALEQHESLEAASKHESIAIIGMGCRFPGADTPEAFWRLLDEGRTAIREVPTDRWDCESLFDPDLEAPGRIAVRAGGFLDEIAGFDAGFFGIAPREALSMDPQQRLLLEVAWEALENAGVPPDQLVDTATGVFVGQCNADYLQRLLWRGDAAIDGYLASGTSPSVTSGRLAYCLGLRGPALTVDTSCSSSLVALHLACRSLRAGETRVALAAGVNLMCAPEASIAMSKAHMLAPDGRSKAFDAAADGLGRGEGIAVLVLKRLTDALADGDPVLALVRGSALNQDGRSAGLTVPNGPAQEAVIAAAVADAGVPAHAIGYVEAHGTGTSLGDPIEVRALSNVLGAGRGAAQPLWIGSVKSNIGHLEGAAGLAGVIKTVLCLQQGRVVPQPLFHTPNPHIPWDQMAIAVATEGCAWPAAAPRLAGVSSFGFSGTNAHVVLEQGPAAIPPVSDDAAARLPVNCLVLSARSPASLRALALRYAELLEQGAPLAQVACDAALGRAHLALRLAVVAMSAATAVDALRAFAAGHAHAALLTGPSPEDPRGAPIFFAPDFDPRVSFGGREWYAASTVFREVIDRADGLLGPDADGLTLSATLWDPTVVRDPARGRAAHVAVQCATAALWRSLGIEPAAIRGAGVGTLAAACLEGELEFPEALRLATLGAMIPRDPTAALPECGPVSVIGTGTGTGAAGSGDWQTLAHTLGEGYVAGAAVNWRALGGSRGGTRLPNYPFDHQRYWVDIARPVNGADTQEGSATREAAAPADGLFYEVQWRELAVRSPIVSAPASRRRFTLVGNGELTAPPAEALADRLAERLRARGDAVRVVGVDAEDAAFEGGELVYLGALSLGARSSADTCAELACAAPVRWLARFGREPAAARQGRAWLVTRGAQPAQGRVTPAGRFQAPLWGVGRVFALEQPRLWGGLVDLPPEAAAPGAELDALLRVLDDSGEEDQIAWRDGRAFVARLERARAPARRPLPLQPHATYLVVGGFGGLGLLIGRWLAQQGARHIALLGRTPNMNLDGVAAIRAAGARVIPLAGDIADTKRLRALLDALAREAPPLKGIVHAATDVSVVPIAELTAPQIAAMLRPKVAGLLALEQAAPAVDFTVLFSSTAALIGARGMAHYAAANAFLDASAQQSGSGMLALNWGTWEVMRAATDADREALREGGLNALGAAQALEAMGRMIATGVRQMAVADIDWSRLKPLYERSRPRPFLAGLDSVPGVDVSRLPADDPPIARAVAPTAAPGTPPPAVLLDLISGLPVEERAEFLETWVREAIANTLGWTDLESVPPGAGLFDLGMDSLMAVSLQRKLERGVGRALPATLTFNHPNARALARYLTSHLGETCVAPESTAATPAAGLRDAEIDALSDAEVEEQLRARLERVG